MADGGRRARTALAPAREVAQVPADRGAADRAGRGRHLLPENRRGGGIRRGGRARRARHQRSDRARQARASCGARAPREHRRAGRRRARRRRDRGRGRAAPACGSTSGRSRRRRASLRRGARRRGRATSHAASPAQPGLRFAACSATTAPRSTCARRASATRRSPAPTAAAIASRDACLERAGCRCAAVTGAGTGTFEREMAGGVYTELQPGSYPFMDADYGRNERAPGALAFEQSLFVLATVMSTPAAGRAIVDAGLKALSFDSGLPLVAGRAGLELREGLRRARRAGLRPSATRRRLGRAAAARAGPLRSDGQPVRLARRPARRPRRMRVAGRARRAG